MRVNIQGWKKDVAVGMVIHDKQRGHEDRHQRWDRIASVPDLAFLHRLVLALHLVCVEISACSGRITRQTSVICNMH
jgi:hypothetical protein